MRSPIAAFLSFSFGFLGFGANTVNFDNVKQEMMPPYWTATSTHAGPPLHWEVEHDKTAPSHQSVFAQVSRRTGATMNSGWRFTTKSCAVTAI